MKTLNHLQHALRIIALAAPLFILAACGGGGGGSSGSGGTPPPLLSGTITGQSRVVTNQLYNYSAMATNGTAANYSWAWGDGSTGASSASAGTQSKIWRAAGDYTANMTITDSTGGSANSTQTVAVVDHPVSTGNEHSCAILSNNTVSCWGRNNLGQLGNGTLINNNVPAVVPGITNVVSLSAYTHGTCVAKTDGTVWCWGDLADIQTLAYSKTPVQMSGLTDVVALAQGNQPFYGPVAHHTCALQRAGTVLCWGGDGWGQLGNGTALSHDTFLLNSFAPVLVTGLSDAVSITAGGQTSCAIKANGTVVCWGYGVVGQVGPGVRNPTAVTQMISIPALVPGVNNAVSIVTSNNLTCAVISDGSVQCWGANNSAQAMVNTTGFTPVTLAGISNVAAMTLGKLHACALKTDTTVECWGTYKTTTQGAATAIKDAGGTPLTNVQSVSSGIDHTCASKFDGTVHCWGWNGSGQLGDSTNVDHTAAKPVIMPGMGKLASGTNHTCAFNSLGQVTCVGQGGLGQLGNGVTGDSTTPVAVNIPGGVKAITSAAYHTCAMKTDTSSGDIACWGYGLYGQLGNGTNVDSNVPVNITIPGGVSAITAGAYHTCALKANGTIACWGQNTFGQLGDGTNTSSNTPVTITIPGGVTAISAGTFHTCALKTNGTMACWGRGAEGQLGNNTYGDLNAPGDVFGLTNVASISSTTFHTSCVRKTNGEAWCWGRGYEGQLGNATNTVTSVPVQVSIPAPGITEISAGYFHVCALQADGNVACWGEGTVGQIGNGTNNSSSVPVVISIPGGVTSISAGYYQTCAFKSNGEVVCWGQGYGNTPVVVPGLGASVTFWK
jgi:alpha-tubulin suppressor-like RCC1 family protein